MRCRLRQDEQTRRWRLADSDPAAIGGGQDRAGQHFVRRPLGHLAAIGKQHDPIREHGSQVEIMQHNDHAAARLGKASRDIHHHQLMRNIEAADGFIQQQPCGAVRRDRGP